MNRADRYTLALQYARRRIREGIPKPEAALTASVRWGLSSSAQLRLIRQLRKETQ